jgi:glycosyltransferase involved in cell wall biosynthesis
MSKLLSGPRIALVTSLRPSGGRRYAESLARALGAEIINASLPTFSIWSQVRKNHFNVVDIQFEYSTFGSHLVSVIKLPLLAALLRFGGTGIITLHGVITRDSLEEESFRGLKWFSYLASVKLAALFSEVLVHSRSMRNSLRNYGIEAKEVPHGSDTGVLVEGVRSANNALFFGFVRRSKGVSNLIEAVGFAKKLRPEVELVIAGSVRNSIEARYLYTLNAKVREANLSETVSFLTGYISDAQKAALASRSSILVLPYTDNFDEVSGVVHDLARFGLALICSDTPRFSELREGVECLKVRSDPKEIADSIIRLMGDDQLRHKLAGNLEAFARATSWEKVAKSRMEIYRRLLSSNRAAS